MTKTINPLYTTQELDEVQTAIYDVDRAIGASKDPEAPELRALIEELIDRRAELLAELAVKLGITSRELIRKRLGIEA